MPDQLDIRDMELNALLEITQAINNNLPEADLYKIYRFTLLGDLKVDQLAMYVLNDAWECMVSFGPGSEKWDQIELPDEFKELQDAVTLEDDKTFSQFDLAFPVKHKQRILAIVFVGGIEKSGEALDTTFLRALTNILIVAIENKKLARKELERQIYRKELEIAKKVQNFLFPKTLPDTSRLKIDAVYLPHNDVGGDYYDYIALPDDKFLVCVADVSGKGVPAALLMSNFQASLRALARKSHDLKEIVSDLNLATVKSSNGENFITVFIGIYDFKTRSMQYVNCGHNPTVIFQRGKMNLLEVGTTVLGMFDPLPFIETETVENLDEFLFFGYTDGLTETFNSDDEQFGLERLIALLEKFKDEDLTVLHQHIFKALDDFRQENSYQDDITMISCQVRAI